MFSIAQTEENLELGKENFKKIFELQNLSLVNSLTLVNSQLTRFCEWREKSFDIRGNIGGILYDEIIIRIQIPH